MKKRRKVKQVKRLVIIVSLLLIGSLTWIIYGSEDKYISYTIQEELKQEGQCADLTIKIVPNTELVKITKILLPDGTSEDNLNTITYQVTENKEYTFIVYYNIFEKDDSGEYQEIGEKEYITYQEQNLVHHNIEVVEENEAIKNGINEEILEESKEQKEVVIANAVGSIEINATNFPDTNFRNWILNKSNINGYGEDRVLTAVEIANITSIDVNNQNISSLKGIQFFTALSSLQCYENQLTELDISANTALTYLRCHKNQLKEIAVNKNTLLQYFNCSENQIEGLDLSKNLALKALYCADNNMGALDVTNNTLLEALNCSNNQLTEINISLNTKIINLQCFDNQLTELDISKNIALEYLRCQNNSISTIDLSSNSKIYYLACSENKLKQLDVSKNPALTSLYCNGNQLSELDITSNNKLVSLTCDNNNLMSVDISNQKLESFSAEGQTYEIPMTFSNGYWRSNTNINYEITSIDNTNITYNKTTGQFTTRYASNPSSKFTTDYKDGTGTVHKLYGTLSFTYSGFVPVTGITGIPTNITVGTSTTLNGTVAPDNASEKTIIWSIKSVGTTEATLSGTTLKTPKTGTVVLTASIAGGTLNGPYTTDFTITVSYGNPDSLTCIIEGTKGKNDWYIGDVTVKPPSGYELSKTLGSGYTSSLLYTSSTTPTVYLKQTSTGALYSAKTLNAIRIDKVDPKIIGITDAGSSIATSKIVTVTDDNLSSVLLYTADSLAELSSATGVPQTVSSGSSSITLTASTKNQYFKVEAEDVSGRKTVYTHTLITPTYEVKVDDIIFDPVDKGYGSIAGIKLNIDVDIGNTSATITSIVSSDTSQFTVSGSGVNWTVTPVTGMEAGKHQVTLTISYDGGRTTTSTVSMVVKETDPYVLIAIPSDTEMERVRNDTMFEAKKEMEVSIATGVDKSLYPGNFYIKTEPRFYLFNTIDNDEWFSVQVYDRNENRHSTKNTPIAVLNKDHTSEKFYIKAFKDIARQRGIYKGTMTFAIEYEETP